MTTRHVAIDLGASGGRVAVGAFTDGNLEVEVVHRFPNGPVERDGGLYWPIEDLWREILTGLTKAGEQGPIESIGVDSWAVDYGLVNKKGSLIDGVRHYRDSRTQGIMENLLAANGLDKVYGRSGIQFLPFNTLYQLRSEWGVTARFYRPEMRWLLMVPDIFHYWLTGRVTNEITNASTTQMLNTRTGSWSPSLLEFAGVDLGMLPELLAPGDVVDELDGKVAAKVGLTGVKVVAPATHDTASAVAAVPAEGEDWAYVSSGTWSLVGVELPRPRVTRRAMEGNFTNELGVNGTTRFLKNMMGLWILQECRRAWGDPDFDTLYAEAEASSEVAIFDPDSPAFLAVGDDMPERVEAAIRDAGHTVPKDRGVLVRSILASLASKTAQILDEIERVTGRKINRIHIVGGGSQIDLLNRLIAQASRREVIAGPVEATLLGNILVQAEACGTIERGSIRRTVRNYASLTTYALP